LRDDAICDQQQLLTKKYLNKNQRNERFYKKRLNFVGKQLILKITGDYWAYHAFKFLNHVITAVFFFLFLIFIRPLASRTVVLKQVKAGCRSTFFNFIILNVFINTVVL